MPNDIYARTHDGLTRMVSARAASQVLNTALTRQGVSPNTVDARTMSDLLMGPVFQGLQHILPRDGLKQRLHALVGSLSSVEEAPKPLPEPPILAPSTPKPSNPEPSTPIAAAPEPPILEPPAPRNLYPKEHLGAPATPGTAPYLEQEVVEQEVMDREDVDLEALGHESRGLEATADPAAETPLRASTAGREQVARRDAGRERLETMALSFAQLEHVVFVAAFQGSEVILARGTGYDVLSLKTLGLMGMRLLEKSGELRSYYLAHERGQLFIFPFGRDTLMVIGQVELSLGVVLSTLAAMKEEL